MYLAQNFAAFDVQNRLSEMHSMSHRLEDAVFAIPDIPPTEIARAKNVFVTFRTGLGKIATKIATEPALTSTAFVKELSAAANELASYCYPMEGFAKIVRRIRRFEAAVKTEPQVALDPQIVAAEAACREMMDEFRRLLPRPTPPCGK